MKAEAQFEVYRDRRGGHRWRLRAANGRIVADCAEGYSSRRAALRGVQMVAYLAPVADLEVIG